jgi:hypothetical protein
MPVSAGRNGMPKPSYWTVIMHLRGMIQNHFTTRCYLNTAKIRMSIAIHGKSDGVVKAKAKQDTVEVQAKLSEPAAPADVLTAAASVSAPRQKEPSPWIHFLPELGSLVMEYIDEPDSFGYLCMVSKEWKIWPDEASFKRLCARIYLAQTARKRLELSVWHSWKNMLIFRPRVRTNGFYWLRTSSWKPPVNDRFWEEKLREFQEVCSAMMRI